MTTRKPFNPQEFSETTTSENSLNVFDPTNFEETLRPENSIYSFDDNREQILVDENGKRFRYNDLDLDEIPYDERFFKPVSKVNLETKQVTPTTSTQSVVYDTGYYGLAEVIIDPIPNNYSYVGNVTATPNDVVLNKIFVDSNGVEQIGTIEVQAPFNVTLDVNNIEHSYIPGTYNVTQTVNIVPEIKDVQSSVSNQIIVPTSGKVLSQVNIEGINVNRQLNVAGGYTVTIGV